MMHTTLYTLFMPPQDCFGDFGLLCGFTATRPVLDQIRRSFTGETTRPMLAAFLHPTINAISDIPGLAWMWMPTGRYNLLHAKVALLGFRKHTDNGYVIRLAVSTGNWTQDPLTRSIDLFWSIDLDTSNPDEQSVADLRAAWSMFNWLREQADCSLIERDYDGHRPDTRLAEAIADLPPSVVEPRFIDSRIEALSPQVIERIGLHKKADRLILGSGYFESEGDHSAGLPERLREALVQKKALKKDPKLDLFLNPQSCQGLAARAGALTDAGWKLRRPFSTLHGEEGRLHAKFILLATGDQEVLGRLYLGSGNLSRNGFECAAKDGGNLEAGVVVDVPKGLSWRRGRSCISNLLPIQFKDTVTLTDLQSGDAFVAPEEPTAQPPVTWLNWREGDLSAPGDLKVAIIGPDGAPAITPCAWPAPAPSIVTLDTDERWRLPVIAEGVLVAPVPSDLTVEDVLASLGSFPEPPDRDPPEDGPEGEEPFVGATDAKEAPPTAYAIRRMMELLVRLSERQKRIDPRDWSRWCRELRQNLCAITTQEQIMICFFRNAKANPLPVLSDPRMYPQGADIKNLEKTLMEALSTVSKTWKLNSYPSLWAKEGADV